MRASDSLSTHFRLNAPHQQALKKLRIETIGDLLYHFPVRYDQSGNESAIGTLVPGTEATIFGTIDKLETRRSWKRKIPVGQARIKDASGSISVMWFHQPYIAKKFQAGAFVKAVGTVGGKDGKLYLANPHVEIADPTEVGLFTPHEKTIDDSRTLFAVYPESRGVSSLWFRHAIEKILKSDVLQTIDDPIPKETLARYHLPALALALQSIHQPENIKHAEAARKRFSFEEMFVIQVARALDRCENDTQSAFGVDGAQARAETFLSSLPFPPTGAQKRAIADILGDLGKVHPMARLLEGDVGSGKTLVAAATAYAIVTSRPPNRESGTLQVAYMAPTEILAQQHFESFIHYFRELPINIALLTGSGGKKFPSKLSPEKATTISRAQLLKWVANGEIAMVVGTHALIQKSVQFQRLAYAIVDEQHRFGTKQRKALAQKSSAAGGKSFFGSEDQAPTTRDFELHNSLRPAAPKKAFASGRLPHFLSMTATPIPRTLALTIYGDLDISVLDELPPGRAKITTKIISAKERALAYDAMRAQLKKGHQAYVICPRIEEPDPKNQNALQAKSVKAESARLKKDIFPEYEIGLLHGAMPAKGGSASGGKPSKEQVMQDFADHKIDILVATSVVEVGVNVPNATVILIEGAERFGLAQLHQLRGRVMRSSAPPLCFLLPESRSEISLRRLRALEKSSDGFALAEADLEARGSGDLFGNSQWGVSDLGMEALKNPKLIQAARSEAHELVLRHNDALSNAALARRVAQINQQLHSE